MDARTRRDVLERARGSGRRPEDAADGTFRTTTDEHI